MGVSAAVFWRRGDAGFIGPLLGASRGVVGFSGALLGASRGVVGFNVAMFVRPVREICLPARLDVGASAKKFAQRAENTPNPAFLCLLGEFFRGRAAGGTLPGELFRGLSGGEGVLGELCRVYRHGSHVSQVTWCHTCRKWWGFCTIRSWLAACRRRVVLLMVQFPPFGGGEAAT